MNLLEALKAAKKHLATDNCKGKTDYVCHAVTHAFIEKYGNFLLDSPDRRTQEQIDLNEKLEALQKEVVERLYRLQRHYGIGTIPVFTKSCAKAVLGLDSANPSEVQKARHVWLDSMIEELEDAESN